MWVSTIGWSGPAQTKRDKPSKRKTTWSNYRTGFVSACHLEALKRGAPSFVANLELKLQLDKPFIILKITFQYHNFGRGGVGDEFAYNTFFNFKVWHVLVSLQFTQPPAIARCQLFACNRHEDCPDLLFYQRRASSLSWLRYRNSAPNLQPGDVWQSASEFGNNGGKKSITISVILWQWKRGSAHKIVQQTLIVFINIQKIAWKCNNLRLWRSISERTTRWTSLPFLHSWMLWKTMSSRGQTVFPWNWLANIVFPDILPWGNGRISQNYHVPRDIEMCRTFHYSQMSQLTLPSLLPFENKKLNSQRLILHCQFISCWFDDDWLKNYLSTNIHVQVLVDVSVSLYWRSITCIRVWRPKEPENNSRILWLLWICYHRAYKWNQLVRATHPVLYWRSLFF